MIICVLNLAIADTCAAFAPTFLLYSVLRFLAGISISVILTNSMVLGVEWTGRKFQAITVPLLLCSAGLGQVLLGGLAYFVRNWQNLQLALSIPVFFLLPFTRCLAESARWLISTNKPQEALKELWRAARINGMKNYRDKLTVEVSEMAVGYKTQGRHSPTCVLLSDKDELSKSELGPLTLGANEQLMSDTPSPVVKNYT
ncbi:steroid transmembrane transporter SLC22A24-like [Dipodomys merriami]|uniref:steroid transmembrane transporter SLC22A24-like n=1 Tax=Dipodomys merriami TaxID=94247 RepID=UPI003855A9EB